MIGVSSGITWIYGRPEDEFTVPKLIRNEGYYLPDTLYKIKLERAKGTGPIHRLMIDVAAFPGEIAASQQTGKYAIDATTMQYLSMGGTPTRFAEIADIADPVVQALTRVFQEKWNGHKQRKLLPFQRLRRLYVKPDLQRMVSENPYACINGIANPPDAVRVAKEEIQLIAVFANLDMHTSL